MADLDPAIMNTINSILAKDVNDLTDYDKDFLKARSPYLSRTDKTKYNFVLKESKDEVAARVQREEEIVQAKEEAEVQSQHDQNAHLEPVDDEEDEEEIG